MHEGVKMEQTKDYIAGLIERARKAQAVATKFTQGEARRVAACIGWLAIQRAEAWEQASYDEIQMGDVASKVARTKARARGLMRDLNEAKTVGIVEVDEAKQLMKIAKPVGVIGAVVPTTVPEGVVFIKAMNGIIGRNALVFAPHPRADKITNLVADDIRKLLKKMGLPEDLVICIERPSLDKTTELMRQCDLIIATGGAGLVKAAYSSGTPAYGVGAGNVVTVIDETADVKDVAHKLMESQINDQASGCSTENAAVIQKGVYDAAVKAMVAEDAYLCNAEEKAKLQATLWKDGHLNGEVIVKPAAYIAQKAGIKMPADRTWIQAYSGAGHSCGIHSFNEEHILKFALETKTSRVAVRMPQNKSNAGNWNNGMPFTITLGCGTWGKNISSENITWKHYINTTWVAREIPEFRVPTDEELFGDVMKATSLFEG